MLLLRTLASSNRCKTRQSDWCAYCQDMNTSHRHLYVFTSCRLSLESISRLLCSVSSTFMDTLLIIFKVWSPSIRLRHTTSAQAPVSGWKTIHDDRKKRFAIELFQCIRQGLEQSPTVIYGHSKNFNAFKSLLKTHYFRQAFNL